MSVESRKEAEASDLNALPVLVVDLESLKCVQALAVNFSDWGCKLIGPELGVLNKNIGIRLEGDEEFVRGRITGKKLDHASVVFDQEENGSRDKRREKRYPVTVPAILTDLSRKQNFPCTITNASRTGCRVDGQGLKNLPADILLCVESFGAPVVGQVMWKNSTSAGLTLNWNGMRGLGKSGGARKVVAQKKVEQSEAIKLKLSRL